MNATPPNKELLNWVWYTVLAVFFGMTRTIIRQEYKNPFQLLFVTVISFGCAMFVAFELKLLNKPEWLVIAAVSLTSLLAHDLLKMILNFGDAGSKDKGYLANLLGAFLGRTIPAPKDPDEPKKES